MRCGSCRGEHATVAEVRSCFGAPASVPTVRQPSPRQRSLAQALVKERLLPERLLPAGTEAAHLMVEQMSLDEIRDFIDEMLLQPHVKEDLVALFARLDNGRYAIRCEDGAVRFYRASGGKVRWLWELIGAPGQFRERKIYRPSKVLKRIVADPMAAMILFGTEVGVCGRCGSPLTNERTRKRGMGDDCYAKTIGG